MRFQKLIPIEEETVDSESDFQNAQTYAVFDNDDEVITRRSSSSSRFNYQKEIQYRKMLRSDNF